LTAAASVSFGPMTDEPLSPQELDELDRLAQRATAHDAQPARSRTSTRNYVPRLIADPSVAV
jgi:hypothetical protein